MTTSSEDVLLQMGEVRYKKGDGTLYVMNERLAWMAEHRDTVTVSHRYADIKSNIHDSHLKNFRNSHCLPISSCSTEDLARRKAKGAATGGVARW